MERRKTQPELGGKGGQQDGRQVMMTTRTGLNMSIGMGMGMGSMISQRFLRRHRFGLFLA